MFEKIINKLKPKSQNDYEVIKKIIEIEMLLVEHDVFHDCLRKIDDLLLHIEDFSTKRSCDDEFNLSELHSKLLVLRLFFGYENYVFYEKSHKNYNADIVLKTFFINKLTPRQILTILKIHIDCPHFFKGEADFKRFLEVYRYSIIKLMQNLDDIIFFQNSRYFQLMSRNEQSQFKSSIDQVIHEEIISVSAEELFQYGIKHVKAAIKIFKDNRYCLMTPEKAMRLIIKYREDFNLMNVIIQPPKNIVYQLAKKCSEATLLLLENEKKYRSSLLTTQEFEYVIASHKEDKKFMEFLIKNYKLLCSKFLLFKLDQEGFLDFIAKCSGDSQQSVNIKRANIMHSPFAFFNRPPPSPGKLRIDKEAKTTQRKGCCALV